MGRRGPKRANGKRESNGQLSRRRADVEARGIEKKTAEEQAILTPALAARERVFGVSKAMSMDQMAGSFVGRLRLAQKITQAQYDAAVAYHYECHRHRIACHVPREPGAIDLNATKGGIGDYEDVHTTLVAYGRYDAARNAIQAKQNELRNTVNLFGALHLTVLDDKTLPHLLPELQIALTALVQHYGFDNPRPAKRRENENVCA